MRFLVEGRAMLSVVFLVALSLMIRLAAAAILWPPTGARRNGART